MELCITLYHYSSKYTTPHNGNSDIQWFNTWLVLTEAVSVGGSVQGRGEPQSNRLLTSDLTNGPEQHTTFACN